MKNRKKPDPNMIHPVPGYDKEIYVKPTITNPNIIVGDFTYIADSEFESHVTHLYQWNGDKLIIGKFCQIASGVEFVMNGANHQMNSVSTFPFYTLDGWEMESPTQADLPLKGDTVIGNDVWIGQNAVILPGVHIGDGAIIGANSIVGADVKPYTIVVGNPAKELRKRFNDELIDLLLRFKWWDKGVEEINSLIPILTCNDLEKVKAELVKRLDEQESVSCDSSDNDYDDFFEDLFKNATICFPPKDSEKTRISGESILNAQLDSENCSDLQAEMLKYYIYRGAEYYFWDWRRETVGKITISHVYSDHFSFRYIGTEYSCSYKMAGDKLYDSPNEVPVPEWWQKQHEMEQRKKEEARKQLEFKYRQERLNTYVPSRDVMVEYGD